MSEVVTLDARDTQIVALYAEVACLEKRVAVLTTVVRLLVTLVRVSGATLAGVRVPSASGKRDHHPLVVHQDAELAAVEEHVMAQVDVVQSNSMWSRSGTSSATAGTTSTSSTPSPGSSR
ncbi:MAG: hypothetical protein AB8I08_38010 [Sandaracinaceae bacterium]